ncbi:helix-turn-helix transcriptional regulator [Spongisporangium articulatum]|uniref:Helix-turn-helix transcriptional regulator n=1 Tax=Spongisporangium articulatum TaxID=3362603 RepID=A0ABW8AJI7_9ACTN
MSQTSARLLQLLSLLQTPREWPGPELARKLEVSTRTVRNDVERLRDPGYPVEATRGAVGGYRLAAGTAMPPLLLEDDEAVAIAVSLRTVAGGAVEGIEETSLRALAKLQQVLPKRLAAQVEALQAYTVRVAGGRGGPQVDSRVLALLAAAARDHERVRFQYSDHSGAATERRVEPHRLVNWGRRWYLVAWDGDRDDWRTFRVDRLSEPTGIGHRFRPRPLPEEDVAAYVSRNARRVRQKFHGEVVVHAGAEQVVARMGAWSEGMVTALGADRCLLSIGADDADDLARWMAYLGWDFEVRGPEELRAAVRAISQRYARAAG